MKILCVVGTRPEAIKMAPVILALRDDPRFDCRLCVSAQHREMLDQVMETFGLQPETDLNVMGPGQDLYDVTSRVLLGMRDVIADLAPDIVLVHGDTATTMAASIASFYQKTPVGHVEAGLRTGDILSPWPEEANRKIVSAVTRFHFAPTASARRNLLDEKIAASDILVTGNTVIDALHIVRDKVAGDTAFQQRFRDANPWFSDQRRIVLVTGHRRESFGEGFENICRALNEAAAAHPDVDIVYPVHLNPNVRRPVEAHLSGRANIHLIEPLDYYAFVYLMSSAHLIVTDSGGIQEEAPSIGIPVLVMREITERPEAVEEGSVRLVGTDQRKIREGIAELLTNDETYTRMSVPSRVYGDGGARHKIVEFLAERQGEL